MSAASNTMPRRSVRVAVILATAGVALCFAAAFGLIEQRVSAEPATAEAARITD